MPGWQAKVSPPDRVATPVLVRIGVVVTGNHHPRPLAHSGRPYSRVYRCELGQMLQTLGERKAMNLSAQLSAAAGEACFGASIVVRP